MPERPLITSTANPAVKAARALRDRKHRRQAGAVLVTGGQSVGRAIAGGQASLFRNENDFRPSDVELNRKFARLAGLDV